MTRRIKHKGMSLGVKYALEDLEADRFQDEAMLLFRCEFPESSDNQFESFWDYQEACMNVKGKVNSELKDSFYEEYRRNVKKYSTIKRTKKGIF